MSITQKEEYDDIYFDPAIHSSCGWHTVSFLICGAWKFSSDQWTAVVSQILSLLSQFLYCPGQQWLKAVASWWLLSGRMCRKFPVDNCPYDMDCRRSSFPINKIIPT